MGPWALGSRREQNDIGVGASVNLLVTQLALRTPTAPGLTDPSSYSRLVSWPQSIMGGGGGLYCFHSTIGGRTLSALFLGGVCSGPVVLQLLSVLESPSGPVRALQASSPEWTCGGP